MFNKTLIAPVVRENTNYVTKEIHEHRAPTDASVRLLREMEAKAKAEITAAVHVNDTAFDCVVHIQKMMVDNSTKFLAIFSLNGKRLTAEHTQHYMEEPRQAILAFRDEMARTVANEVLQPAFEKAQWPFREYD